MTVDMDRLADALTDYDYAFLVTVGDDYLVHTVMVQPQMIDGVIDAGEVGDRTGDNVAQHGGVTLVWPPPEPGGYALMVDGRAEPGGDGGLRVVPTKALLHRNAAPGSPAAESGCLHDCVVFKA